MSIAASVSKVWTEWQWPGDVGGFAESHEGEQYLEPLKETLARLFPTAVSARVEVYLDPELRDERHIAFEVSVPAADLPDYLAAKKAWYKALFDICPAVKVWMFGL